MNTTSKAQSIINQVLTIAPTGWRTIKIQFSHPSALEHRFVSIRQDNGQMTIETCGQPGIQHNLLLGWYAAQVQISVPVNPVNGWDDIRKIVPKGTVDIKCQFYIDPELA